MEDQRKNWKILKRNRRNGIYVQARARKTRWGFWKKKGKTYWETQTSVERKIEEEIKKLRKGKEEEKQQMKLLKLAFQMCSEKQKLIDMLAEHVHAQQLAHSISRLLIIKLSFLF